MKLRFFIILLIGLIISSCKTSNEVVSSNKISKRKYLQGYHINSELFSRKEINSTISISNNEIRKNGYLNKQNPKTSTVFASIRQLPNQLDYISESDNSFENNLMVTTYTQDFKENSKELKALKKDLKDSLKTPNKKSEKNEGDKGDTAALLSLIFGTLGFATMWFTGLGLLFLLTGFILGFVGLKSENKKNLAIIGLIFSGLGILIFIALVVLLAALFL